MGGFRFRLQVLLDLRARQEDEARAVWSARIREAELERQKLEAIHAEQRALQASVEGAKRGVMNVGGLLEASSMAEYLRARARQQEVALQEAIARVADAQRQLQAAATARKAVDKLRERRKDEFEHEEQRKDQSFLDEIAVLRAARREPRVAQA